MTKRQKGQIGIHWEEEKNLVWNALLTLPVRQMTLRAVETMPAGVEACG